MFKFRLLILITFLVLTTVMYWWASEPRSLWILWLTIPAFLIGLVIELIKKRKAEKAVD